jgi:predicted N-acyltransferase
MQQEIKNIIQNDKNRWVKIAKFILHVERKSEWKNEGFTSFTSWIKQLSTESKLHISYFWRILSVSKILHEAK